MHLVDITEHFLYLVQFEAYQTFLVYYLEYLDCFLFLFFQNQKNVKNIHEYYYLHDIYILLQNILILSNFFHNGRIL